MSRNASPPKERCVTTPQKTAAQETKWDLVEALIYTPKWNEGHPQTLHMGVALPLGNQLIHFKCPEYKFPFLK